LSSFAEVIAASTTAVSGTSPYNNGAPSPFEQRTLDGSANNLDHPAWGQAGNAYVRVAHPRYADRIASIVDGPNARLVSDRVFNDVGVNLFSERGVSQWVWSWGQFIDHDLALRDQGKGEDVPIFFNAAYPLEGFTNDLGTIAFSRTPAAPGTGASTPREQINTLSSFIDASNVYGTTPDRLDWLRAGANDGDPANNEAALLLPNSYLPRATERGDASTAPTAELVGALAGTPQRAAIAGDVRPTRTSP
jgi:hypothetical protein